MIGTADIARVKSGALAAYEIELHDELLGDIGTAKLHDYPRYSASVLDLVARGIAAALADGREELPARPVLPEVTVYKSSDGIPYVRLYEIPEPTRTLFLHNLSGSTHSAMAGDPRPMDCAYAWDWEDFLSGGR
ncbi:hypothetical protein [Paraburkholderia sp. RL17-337-BIB-A]|uniref:hypothetical protein n=1 Tax=Paraburkholderia sp. RL17-337-BIB-A TaxID=3031636 RepID=UPI0038B8F2F3